jgi:AmiR/NasT family two-component response regulator
LLDRAKGLLIDQHSLSEQAAFDFIQKMAMSKRMRMRDVAVAVLSGEITP